LFDFLKGQNYKNTFIQIANKCGFSCIFIEKRMFIPSEKPVKTLFSQKSEQYEPNRCGDLFLLYLCAQIFDLK